MKLSTYLHFLRHALWMKMDRRHRVPLTMNLHVSGACSNRCLYCVLDNDNSTDLSLDLIKTVLHEAWSMGGRRVNLTGGEPLLRDDLAEIVHYAKDRGFFVSLATCGARAQDQVEALRAVDRVMLSLDGPREIHDELCGPGSFEALQQGIDVFETQGVSYWTTTVLTKLNIPHIDWIVGHARSHDIQANFVLLLMQREPVPLRLPSAGEVAEILPDDGEIRAAVKQLMQLKRAGAPIGSSMPYLKQLLEWPDYSDATSPKLSRHYRCVAHQATCELLSDGMLYSCVSVPGCSAGVSVSEHGFAKAFTRLPEIENCRSCAISCQLESNLIFSLNTKTIWNWMRLIGK
ncbi:MAG: radical SAM protein [Kiritimatiellia bacterium]|jgi:MoaA/NifB/PqqE/SkfB family radical SAM enzyme|nr:radical SAM protein [Kiritimatiellia bacterium]